MVQSRRQSCMDLDSDAALIPANDLFEKTNKLAHVHVPLDGGLSMLERARIVVVNDSVWHHIGFLLMIKFVNFFSEMMNLLKFIIFWKIIQKLSDTVYMQ